PTHTPPLSTLSLHDALPISQTTAPTASDIVSTRSPVKTSLVLESLKKDSPFFTLSAIWCSTKRAARKKVMARIPFTGISFSHTTDRKSTRLNSSHQIISYAV